jgi:hypothetical protein
MAEIYVKSSKKVLVDGYGCNISIIRGIKELYEKCTIEELRWISEELGNPTYSITWRWTGTPGEWEIDEYNRTFSISSPSTKIEGPLGTLPNVDELKELEEAAIKERRLEHIRWEEGMLAVKRQVELDAFALTLIQPGVNLKVIAIDLNHGLIAELDGHKVQFYPASCQGEAGLYVVYREDLDV